jgi:hypothetical protein
MTDYSNRRWVILPFADVTDEIMSDVLQQSASGLRRTLSGDDLTFVKYEGAQPSSLSGLTEYTHSEILDILNDENGNW